MRAMRTVQGSIFEEYAEHETGRELKAIGRAPWGGTEENHAGGIGA